jgi:carbon-monoxide dehydrogenase medium subunit
LQLKGKFGSAAIFMAGGTDEMVNLHGQYRCPFEHLISLTGIKGFDRIEETEGSLHIGATATHTELAKSDLIKSKYAILRDATALVGSAQIRNVGTIGGNVCSSLPSADTSCPLLALGAKVKIASAARGEHVEDMVDFFLAPGKNILREDELVVEFIVPAVAPRSAGGFYKIGRRKALEIAILSASVVIELDADRRTCRAAGIALSTVAPTPLRVNAATAELIGKPVTEETLTSTGWAAVREASPRDSFRSDAAYRKEMIPVAVKRAGLLALERAYKA